MEGSGGIKLSDIELIVIIRVGAVMWEMTRVSYSLRTGVIVRQPTIKVQKGSRRSEKCFSFHKPNSSFLELSSVTVSKENVKAGKAGLGGSALCYIPAAGSTTLRVEARSPTETDKTHDRAKRSGIKAGTLTGRTKTHLISSESSLFLFFSGS